mgnify:CR=1 FL=1
MSNLRALSITVDESTRRIRQFRDLNFHCVVWREGVRATPSMDTHLIVPLRSHSLQNCTQLRFLQIKGSGIQHVDGIHMLNQLSVLVLVRPLSQCFSS